MSDYNTHGGYYAPNLIHIGAGGTHEENPNGGVPFGVDMQEIPNLVEQGEDVYNDYVFSDRLKVTARELREFGLPEKFEGKTFAYVSEKLSDEATLRPNDAISAKGMGAMLDRLLACQEAHKQRQEQAKMRRQLNKMSPEELMALGAQLNQAQQAQQGALAQVPPEYAMQQGIPEQRVPQEMGLPAEALGLSQTVPQPQVAAEGGYLANMYFPGGPKGGGGERAWVYDPEAKAGGRSIADMVFPGFDAKRDAVTARVDDWLGEHPVVQFAADMLPTSALEVASGPAVREAKAAEKGTKGVSRAMEIGEGIRGKTIDLSGLGRVTGAYFRNFFVPWHEKSLMKSTFKATAEGSEKAAEKVANATARRQAQKIVDRGRKAVKELEKQGASEEVIAKKIDRTNKKVSNVLANVTDNNSNLGWAGTKLLGAKMGEKVSPGLKNVAGILAGWGSSLYPWLIASPVIVVSKTNKSTKQQSNNVKDVPAKDKKVKAFGGHLHNRYAGPAGDDNSTTGFLPVGPEYQTAFNNWLWRNTTGYTEPNFVSNNTFGVNWLQGFPEISITSSNTTDRQGAFDPELKKRQAELIALGYDLGPTGADGVMGKYTRAAIAKYDQDIAAKAAAEKAAAASTTTTTGGLSAKLRAERDAIMNDLSNIDVSGTGTAATAAPVTGPSNQPPVLPTDMRYAGAIGNGLMALYNAFQEPTRFNFGTVSPRYVNSGLSLQYQRFNPYDYNLLGAQLGAQTNATTSAIGNAGLGPGTGNYLLAAADNAGRAQGNAFWQTQMNNDQNRANTILQNNAARQQMAAAQLQADMANAGTALQAERFNLMPRMQEQIYNDQAESEKWAAVSAALNAGLTDLSNIGRENMTFNQVNSNSALLYGVTPDGVNVYKAPDGTSYVLDATGNKIPYTGDVVTPSANVPERLRIFHENLQKAKDVLNTPTVLKTPGYQYPSLMRKCGGKINKKK